MRHVLFLKYILITHLSKFYPRGFGVLGFIARNLAAFEDAPFKDGGEIIARVKKHVYERRCALAGKSRTLPTAVNMDWKLHIDDWQHETLKHADYFL